MTKHNRAVRRPFLPTLTARVWKMPGGLWAFHLDGSETSQCVISFAELKGTTTHRATAEDVVRNFARSIGFRIALIDVPPDAAAEGGAQ